jgi:hypothetical protein
VSSRRSLVQVGVCVRGVEMCGHWYLSGLRGGRAFRVGCPPTCPPTRPFPCVRDATKVLHPSDPQRHREDKEKASQGEARASTSNATKVCRP